MAKKIHNIVERSLLLHHAKKSSLGEKASVMDSPLAATQDSFPMPTWTRARTVANRRLPQSIAHRGYKDQHPENTLKAFKAAVEDAGAHAIETDIHLSRDDVVVLSHDPDLKRCFGKKNKIINCDWEYLSQLRTLREPHEAMPRLKDLLEYLAQPQNQNIWLLLDIKIDNNANDVMKLIAETLNSVHSPIRPWRQRVVLGIWIAKFLPLCVQYLPEYTVCHIGFASFYARQFLKVPNIAFNMLQKTLLGPIGSRFMKDVTKAERPLYVWTVNKVKNMKWSIQHEVDGVITDDPKTFNEICDNWDDDEPLIKPTWAQSLYAIYLWCFFRLIVLIRIQRMFPETVEQFLASESARNRISPAFEA